MATLNHISTASFVAVAVAIVAADTFTTCSRLGKAARPRRRRTVVEIHKALGSIYFRRAYRMADESFWILHSKIEHGIVKALGKRNGHDHQCNLPPTANGSINISVRLACALRYFAGGSPYDIMVTYGISHTDVFVSVWSVVEAINQVKEFFILYPGPHDKQQKIAANFLAVLQAGFDNCADAIDRILIWINKPKNVELVN